MAAVWFTVSCALMWLAAARSSSMLAALSASALAGAFASIFTVRAIVPFACADLAALILVPAAMLASRHARRLAALAASIPAGTPADVQKVRKGRARIEILGIWWTARAVQGMELAPGKWEVDRAEGRSLVLRPRRRAGRTAQAQAATANPPRPRTRRAAGEARIRASGQRTRRPRAKKPDTEGKP